ncbi:MAG TPA: LacI family DNA-binding transcriptional regulator [Candidatus Dormibacteraeota bacterium]
MQRTTSVTLKDVARAAGIHYSTASRALDPAKRKLVNSATAAHVRKVAAQLGYNQDMVARSLRRGQTNTVGIVVPDFENPTWAAILHGVTSALERSGYVGLLGETEDDHDRYQRLLEKLVGWRVDAVVSMATRLSDGPYLREFASRGVPIVLAIRTLPGEGFVNITEDSVLGGSMAAEHLIGLGHRSLAQLRGPSQVQTFEDRGRGFVRAAADHGIDVLEMVGTGATPTYEEGRRLMGLLLDRDAAPPTAVFAHNDLMAIGAMDVLAAREIRCPDDVSVIGYNDSPLVEHVRPALTTIRLPAAELGQLAGTSVVKLVERAEDPPESTVLPPTLVVRASTAPPRPL